MFVKIEGGYINLDLAHTIDGNDDGTATLWFAGTGELSRDVTADDMKAIEAAIRHECVSEEIEPPTAATYSVVDACKAAGLPVVPVGSGIGIPDNLKPIRQGSPELGEYWVYDAEDVDRVIAAKDAEIAELKATRKRLEEAIGKRTRRKG